MNDPLTIAVPTGRLTDSVLKHLAECGMAVCFEHRRLSARDSSESIEVYKVKNSDLPTYVHHGIAGLGIAGDDTVAESGFSFTRAGLMPFGGTRLCLAAPAGSPSPESLGGTVTVATSYVRLTRDWFPTSWIWWKPGVRWRRTAWMWFSRWRISRCGSSPIRPTSNFITKKF